MDQQDLVKVLKNRLDKNWLLKMEGKVYFLKMNYAKKILKILQVLVIGLYWRKKTRN